MRIFCAGDTHCLIDIQKILDFKDMYAISLNRDDYLIICGDFGITWDYNIYNYMLSEIFDDFPCTVLFVDGNHENFDMLNSHPVDIWHGGKVHIISSNVIHLMRGQVFNINGFKIFSFGGAKSTERGGSENSNYWWKEELSTKEERFEALENLKKHNFSVDLIVTHDGPSLVVEEMLHSARERDVLLIRLLDFIYRTTNFGRWVFGHYHVDKKYINCSCLFDIIIEIIK